MTLQNELYFAGHLYKISDAFKGVPVVLEGGAIPCKTSRHLGVAKIVVGQWPYNMNLGKFLRFHGRYLDRETGVHYNADVHSSKVEWDGFQEMDGETNFRQYAIKLQQ